VLEKTGGDEDLDDRAVCTTLSCVIDRNRLAMGKAFARDAQFGL
jgi:hypothetical protein